MIFEPYFQDLAKDVIRINRIPITKEEKDLEDVLGEELDWIGIDVVEDEVSSNKHLHSTSKNNTSVDLFVTKDFSLVNSN